MRRIKSLQEYVRELRSEKNAALDEVEALKQSLENHNLEFSELSDTSTYLHQEISTARKLANKERAAREKSDKLAVWLHRRVEELTDTQRQSIDIIDRLIPEKLPPRKLDKACDL